MSADSTAVKNFGLKIPNGCGKFGNNGETVRHH